VGTERDRRHPHIPCSLHTPTNPEVASPTVPALKESRSSYLALKVCTHPPYFKLLRCSFFAEARDVRDFLKLRQYLAVILAEVTHHATIAEQG
jgi:hypothetical protein